jgi:putative glutathione S-transferase
MGYLLQGTWHDGWYDTRKTGGEAADGTFLSRGPADVQDARMPRRPGMAGSGLGPIGESATAPSVARGPRLDPIGEFVRAESQFRRWVTADGSSGFKAEPGRYHLYVSLACPWAHRTLIFRKLKQLEDVISVTVVDPVNRDQGWEFSDAAGCGPDPLYGARFLHELYTRAEPAYSGRVTVPMLWDKHTHTIVNNESSEIIRMLNSAFDAFTPVKRDYYPAPLRPEIDAVNAWVYDTINNGVYTAGFAGTQPVYEAAVTRLFAALDELEARLGRARYLVGKAAIAPTQMSGRTSGASRASVSARGPADVQDARMPRRPGMAGSGLDSIGDTLTEADWRLFPTLVRFDAVYVTHFKCNLRRIADYPNISNYVRDLYQVPGVAGTVDLDHIKRHYFLSHTHLNPGRLVPLGPELDFSRPHDRARFLE